MKTDEQSTIYIFAARPCGMEAGGQPWYRTQVNPQAGWSGWVSVPDSTTPDIRSCRDSSEGGDYGKRLILTPGDLHGSAEGGGSVHRILKLVHRMLKAKVVLPDGTVVSTDEGAPQGGPLSPLLSNVVLDELDKEMARRGLRFVRYADDFQIFVRSERAGERVMGSVRRFIEGRLRLKVNEAKSSVARPDQLHFLGFTLKRNREGGVEIHLSERSEQRLNRRIRELTPRTWGSSLNACMKQVNRYLRGWYGYFRLCTRQGARRFSRYDARVRRRLRAITVRQKGRRPRFLYRHLRSRGVSRGSARKTAYGRRGTWHQSFTYGMHQAYGNVWFAERLALLWDRWQQEHPEPTRVSGRQLDLFG